MVFYYVGSGLKKDEIRRERQENDWRKQVEKVYFHVRFDSKFRNSRLDRRKCVRSKTYEIRNDCEIEPHSKTIATIETIDRGVLRRDICFARAFRALAAAQQLDTERPSSNDDDDDDVVLMTWRIGREKGE